MQRSMRWGYAAALSSVALIVVSCSEDTRHPVGPSVPPDVATPLFDFTAAGNGPGACMGDDAFASGLVPGLSSATNLNCTANDIDLASANVTEYSFISATGPFTP